MRTLHTRLLFRLIAVPALLFGSAGTAQAHPFGTPPVVRVEAQGTAVNVTWSAQPDDIAVLQEQADGDVAGYAHDLGGRPGGRLVANSLPDIEVLTGWLQLIAALVLAAVGVTPLRRHVRHRQHPTTTGTATTFRTLRRC